MDGIPDTIPIIHDDYHAKHIGKLADGQQFFLTAPFVPAFGDTDGGEYIALFTFDTDGKLLSSQIDNLGPRKSLDQDAASKLYDERLASLDNPQFSDIRIAPFKTVHDGVEFGLIPRECEDDVDVRAIELKPGNYMAFFDPWDGYYDT